MKSFKNIIIAASLLILGWVLVYSALIFLTNRI